MLRQTLQLLLVGEFVLMAALGSAAGPAQAADPPPARPNLTITVFAAASLADAFRDLGQRFERYNPGLKVVFNFAGSQQLAAQLNQGAPADVFASADIAQMKAAAAGGRVYAATVFVLNRLVLITPADNPGGLQELKDLAKPGLKIVLAAPTVPVGQYTADFLDKASQDQAYGPAFKAGVLQNVVSYEDNVKPVFAKVALGEADAGLVYTTDVLGANAQKVTQFYIPDDLNRIARYPIAVVKEPANGSLFWSRAFVRYVLSPDGQRVLRSYGFIKAAPTKR